jgi:tryptophan synthase alpha chain
MSRLDKCFKELELQDKTALIVYLVAGDPNRALTVPLMHEMVKSGADVIELGVPFSDPEAEGPVIQAACERALNNSIRLADVLDIVREFRLQDNETPVLLMGYVNPIERMGYKEFASSASQCGVDGTIIVNLPPEEGVALNAEFEKVGIDPVYLLAPTTTEKRAQQVCRASRGFIYYVSLKGVTGAAGLDVEEVSKRLDRIGKFTDLPIAVGFGIKDGVTAAAIARVADAVVVGSVLVDCISKYDGQPETLFGNVGTMVADIRHAMDAA